MSRREEDVTAFAKTQADSTNLNENAQERERDVPDAPPSTPREGAPVSRAVMLGADAADVDLSGTATAAAEESEMPTSGMRRENAFSGSSQFWRTDGAALRLQLQLTQDSAPGGSLPLRTVVSTDNISTDPAATQSAPVFRR